MSTINLPYFRSKVLERKKSIPFQEKLSLPVYLRKLDRRHFIKWIGFTSFSFAPIVSVLGKMLSSGFQMDEGDGWVRFTSGGITRWTIAQSWFEGPAQLKVQTSEDDISIQLKNALFPGTELSADFTAQIVLQEMGYQMDIHWAALGHQQTDHFVRWLCGKEDLHGRLQRKQKIGSFDAEKYLWVDPGAEMSFTPDWKLLFQRPNIASLSYAGNVFPADQLSILLNSPHPQSAINEVDLEKETLLELSRQKGGYVPLEKLDFSGNQKLSIEDEPFDRIFIEAGTDTKGLRHYTFLQQQERNDAQAYYCPDLNLTLDDHHTYQQPLSQLHLAAQIHDGKQSFALFAAQPDKPTIFHLRGSTFTLGPKGTETQPVFEVYGEDHTIKWVHFAPAILDYSLPIEGAHALTFRDTADRRLIFNENVNKALSDERTSFVQLESKGQQRLTENNQLVLPVLRTEDMVALLFHFINFKWNTQRKVIERGDGEALISVYFPPQSIVEEAFFISATPNESAFPKSLPVEHRMSGPSRLVFSVPKNITEIPNDIESLLDWSRFTPVINPRGLSTAKKDRTTPPKAIDLRDYGLELRPVEKPKKKEETREPVRPRRSEETPVRAKEAMDRLSRLKENVTMFPQSNPVISSSIMADVAGDAVEWVLMDNFQKPRLIDTYIEMPRRLYLSPTEKQKWLNHGWENEDISELWHSRLYEEEDEKHDKKKYEGLKMRAICSDDAKTKANSLFGRNENDFAPYTALKPKDRHQIVHATSNFSLAKFNPSPLKVDQLMLSSLGAYLNLKGDWDFPDETAFNQLNLIHWSHRSTLGRDHFVKVVYEGYLFPFGHRAALVKITERMIIPRLSTDGSSRSNQPNPVGLSFQWIYIIVREPVKTYDFDKQVEDFGVALHFKEVHLKTKVTPRLDQTDGRSPVVIIPGGEEGAFWAYSGGKPFRFEIEGIDQEGKKVAFSLPLIFVSKAIGLGDPRITTVVETYMQDEDPRTKAPIHRQMMALAPTDDHGKTSFETDELTFGALSRRVRGSLSFHPILRKAKIQHTPIAELLGSSESVEVEPFYNTIPFLDDVFAKLVDTFDLDFTKGADKAGGIATPNLSIFGLSESKGPIGDIFSGGITDGEISPETFLGEALPKLFGAIPLDGILGDLVNDQLPELIRNIIDDKQLELSYTFVPDLVTKKDLLNGLIHFSTEGGSPLFELSATLLKELDSDASPEVTLEGKINAFKVTLFDVISLAFTTMTFKSVNASKPDVVCELPKIVFEGPLSFVNILQDIIPMDGFADPPVLDLTANGLEVGYVLDIPTVSLGMFSLQNISLGAILRLPLIGDDALNFTFNFCEADNPFNLSVAIYGGGGYFSLAVNTGGLERVEAALEFGVIFTMDVSVAKGKVEAKGGFFFATEGNSAQFEGYIRIEGLLHIMKAIKLSMTFNLSMGIDFEKDETGKTTSTVHGKVTIVVEVEVAIFSGSVDVTVEKTMEGEDPNFEWMYPKEEEWAKYAMAFA